METPMVYAVSDTTRRQAQNLPSAGQRPRARAQKSRAAQRTVSIHWPRVTALGLNTLVWVGLIAAARWVFHH
jgi:hypothetical protein